MDSIFIKDLRTRGMHGVADEERTHAQEFLLDIAIDFDTRKAAQSDDLNETIDYNFFRNSAKDIVEHASFHLIEKLADAIAQKVLEDVRIGRVSVTVRKTEMFKDCTPGVTVIRERLNRA
jgi:dihydroneopterin aldolase